MDNLMNCWDKCVSLVNPLATEDIAEGKEILIEDSFTEFFDFCKEKGCFPNNDIYTLIRYGVNVYGDDNYFEEDTERKIQLLDMIFANEK